MEIDEAGIRLEAQKLHRDLPANLKAHVHEDDFFSILRTRDKMMIAKGKATKGIQALAGGVALVVGFLIGAQFSAIFAWILGAVFAFIGFKLAATWATEKVIQHGQEYVATQMGELLVKAETQARSE